jgi:hypothetical protein
MVERLPPGSTTGGPRRARPEAEYRLDTAGDGCTLRKGATTVFVGPCAHAVQAFATDVEQLVSERAHGHVFVHAAVVAWRGRLLVLPGRSYSGKSTLTAALVRAGATYYSDEFAVVDSAGAIHPYPRPLRLREDEDGGERLTSVADVGDVVGSQPLRPTVIAALRFGHAAAPPRLRVVSPGAAALALVANAVPARQRPVEVLAMLAHVADCAALCVEGERGDADAATGTLLTLVDDAAKLAA